MSAKTLEFIETIKSKFADFAASPLSSKVVSTAVVQYNVAIDGNVVKTIVFDMKQVTMTEEPAANADIEITVDDEDIVDVFTVKKFLVDLHAAGKITVKGDESLLAILDERSKLRGKFFAARAAAGH